MTGWDLFAVAAILILGVPHGGLDGAIARRTGWPAGTVSWLGFHLGYIGLAALVTGLWWLFPLPSLALFLLISGLHFGASDIADSGSHWLPWLAHGGLVCIAIPSLQADLVEPLFAILAGTDNAVLLMAFLTGLFIPWAVICAIYCGFAYRRAAYRRPLLGLLLMIALASQLPPLVSFALYFCLWHSRGHMLRLWQSLDSTERRRSALEAAIYTSMAWASAALIYNYLDDTAALSLIQLTFIGLAALTLPHMLLVDFADRYKTHREELP